MAPRTTELVRVVSNPTTVTATFTVAGLRFTSERYLP